MSPSELYIQTPAGRVFVRKHCQHKPNCLLFIHGFLAHGHWWDWVLPTISDDFDWITIDLPGMGQSEHLSSYAIDDLAAALNTVVASIADTHAVYLVAHSFGALVAGHALLQAPTLARGMYCIDMTLMHLSIASQPGHLPHYPIRHYPQKQTLIERFKLLPPETTCPKDRLHNVAANSLKHTPKGWAWSFDPTIWNISKTNVYDAFVSACQKHRWFMGLIMGEASTVTHRERTRDHWEDMVTYPHPQTLVLPGYHHLMLDCPEALATAIKTQFKEMS